MKAYLYTFGCKANQYDTEVVRQSLTAAGATICEDPREADVAVVNSCTVTHVGEAKMRGLVRRLQRLQPTIETVVMGCAAAVDDGMIAALPGVRATIAGADPVQVLKVLGVEGDVDPVLRRFPKGSRAWLRIQDGCDEHCTFCATTVARGANVSRDAEEIVREAHALSQYHAEIVLTGIHIGTYGRDRHTSLGHLVQNLIRVIPGVRFRLSSIEATEVDDRIADLMINAPDRLAPHIHAPLQSGSDRVLKRMGRHWYTAHTYRARCEYLAIRMPAFGLGADVMVGFPGETEQDFAETMAVVDALPFTYLHVFPYSPRPVASSQRLGGPVSPDVVKARSAHLRAVAERKRSTYERQQIGRIADVVPVERSRGRARGLTEDYLGVYFGSEVGVAGRFCGTIDLDKERQLTVVT